MCLHVTYTPRVCLTATICNVGTSSSIWQESAQASGMLNSRSQCFGKIYMFKQTRKGNGNRNCLKLKKPDGSSQLKMHSGLSQMPWLPQCLPCKSVSCVQNVVIVGCPLLHFGQSLCNELSLITFTANYAYANSCARTDSNTCSAITESMATRPFPYTWTMGVVSGDPFTMSSPYWRPFCSAAWYARRRSLNYFSE